MMHRSVWTKAVMALGVVSLITGTSALAANKFTKLNLINGWTNTVYDTAAPAIFADDNDIVYFKGAMLTSGTNSSPFVLPKLFRPKKSVYVTVDMCNATKGRLFIQPDGSVSVMAEGDFSNAQCFTSLDGAFFAK